jgi:hypothetical protein
MTFEMPRPGAPHQTLSRLAGDWVGDETMMPSAYSPQKQQRTCTIRARTFEGFFVVSDYEQRMGAEVTFRGHGVYSWDPQRERYRMHWFDSMGGAGGIADGTLDGDVLTFENTSPQGRHRYRYAFAKDHTRFEMSMSPDGKTWHLLMEGRYRPTGG